MTVAKLLFIFLLTPLVGLASTGQAQAPGSAPTSKGAPAGKAAPDLKAQPELQTQSQKSAPAPQGSSSDKTTDLAKDDGKTDGYTFTLHDLLFFPGILAFVGSLIAVGATYGIYRKTRALSNALADRTVRIEAQKLLLEINKQFVSNPELLAIYDAEFDNLPKERQVDAKLRGSLRAMAYMKINVFEIVFAVHPSGTNDGPWKAYFSDTLQNCTLVRKELRDHEKLYNTVLVNAFKASEESKLLDKEYPQLAEYKATDGTAAQLGEGLAKKLDALNSSLSAPLDPKHPLEDTIRRIVVDQMAKIGSEGGAPSGAAKA